MLSLTYPTHTCRRRDELYAFILTRYFHGIRYRHHRANVFILGQQVGHGVFEFRFVFLVNRFQFKKNKTRVKRNMDKLQGGTEPTDEFEVVAARVWVGVESSASGLVVFIRSYPSSLVIMVFGPVYIEVAPCARITEITVQ